MPAGKSIRRVARAGARLLPPEQRRRVRRTGGALLRRLPPQVAEEVRGVFGIRWGDRPAHARPADALGLAGGFLVILAYRAGEAAIVAPMQYSQILWATAYGWI